MISPAALLLIVICKVAQGQDVSEDVDIYPLDIASHSVDDQFSNCSKNMKHQVVTRYLKKEIAGRSNFGKAWREGKEKHIKPEDNLMKNHSIAIFVYTGSKVFSDFNTDVRNGRQAYKQLAFKWYSLYFYLTKALQILKQTQQECVLTYRGTRNDYRLIFPKKLIRFGSFASSSLDQNKAKNFGSQSCFEIHTCHGANITKYSQKPQEKEVLIPPYEMFEITSIRNNQKGDWCKTVYALNSSGIKSDLDCKVAARHSLKYNRRQRSFSQLYQRGKKDLTNTNIF